MELLGDDGERGGGGLGDAQRQMAGRAAHADDEIPAGGGAGVFHEVADEMDAVVAGGLVTEGGRGAGQRQVVVNGLGDMGDLDFAVAALGDDAGGKGRVIPADGHQRGDAELFKHRENIFHAAPRTWWDWCARCREWSRPEVNVLHVADGQRLDLRGVARREPFEAVAEADDFVTLIDAFNGGRRDDAVESGGRTAADQNSQSAFAHVILLLVVKLPLNDGN